MSEFKDLAVTGELITGLAESERWFEVTAEPFYEAIENADPSKKKEKLTLPVKLGNGQTGVYYPNRTSSRKMAVIAKTTDMNKWIGMKFYWGNILKQNVAGQVKDVLYVTDSYPTVVKK